MSEYWSAVCTVTRFSGWFERWAVAWVGGHPGASGTDPEFGSGEDGGEFVRRSCLSRAVAACTFLQASLSADS